MAYLSLFSVEVCSAQKFMIGYSIVRYSMDIWVNVPTKPIFSANLQFVGAIANNFWQYNKQSFRKFYKFVEIQHLVYFNTGLVQN